MTRKNGEAAMPARDYYSVRGGHHTESITLDFEELKRAFSSTFMKLEEQGYFAQAFGKVCVDYGGSTVGTLGSDIALAFTMKLDKRELWPIPEMIGTYSEDDLFSVIELLHDCVSKPGSSRYHDWDRCGYHYGQFDEETGQADFISEINQILVMYTPKFELSKHGLVLETPATGLESLVAATLPTHDPDNVETKVQQSVEIFLRFKSTAGERKDAVRTLADVLEFLRPKMKLVVSSKDEGDLFNVANNFALRHHNQEQQGDYDHPLYYTWIFYTYLATIHLILGKLAAPTRPTKRTALVSD